MASEHGTVGHRPARKVEAAHGTPARYVHHRCRCDLCRQANREYQRQLSGRLAERRRHDPGSVPHGTTGGYRNWGCRCDACSMAHKTACAAYQAKRKPRGRAA